MKRIASVLLMVLSLTTPDAVKAAATVVVLNQMAAQKQIARAARFEALEREALALPDAWKAYQQVSDSVPGDAPTELQNRYRSLAVSLAIKAAMTCSPEALKLLERNDVIEFRVPEPFRKNVNLPFNHENQTMKANKLAALIVTTYIGFISTAHASAPQPLFSPEQEARIGEIAADYLVSHPEILVTVSNKLQEQQEARKQKMFALNVMENQANLLHDPDTPAYGPDNAKVAVIEFFDYQCVFCSRLAPELEKVMKAQPDVRYLFKEWPIFGGRWETSLQAAQQGLTVWQQKGPQAYVTYHNAIYATGHNEGKLTAQDIHGAASRTGLAAPAPGDHTASLEKNSNLAEELGLTGTPGIIVMPVSGATPDTITVFPEAVTADRLQVAIRKATSR